MAQSELSATQSAVEQGVEQLATEGTEGSWKEGLTQATLSGVAWEAASVELVQMYDSVNQALIEEVLQ